jgi:hypothetical protein
MLSKKGTRSCIAGVHYFLPIYSINFDFTYYVLLFLDLENTANKTLPSRLLPKLTAHALKASSCPDAIPFLPSTVCSSRVTTRNSNFQQLAKDKKPNPNQWEVHLIEFKSCEDTRPDPQLQKAKAQHSMLIANLNRQGNREVRLRVILVGAMGTI